MTNTGDSRLTPRHAALELIDVSNMRGLELGPMYRPLVPKSAGSVQYLDVYSTQELRQRYRDDPQAGPHVDEIVDIDFVLTEGLTLAQITGTSAPFDYIIASHVIEHVANPLGWFEETSEILESGGLISLTIPDKRFSFDVNRDLTRPHDWIEWHLRDLRAPSYGQIFDHYAHIVHDDGLVDTAGLWAGTADYSGQRLPDATDPDVSAYSICLQRRDSGDYIDAHAGVYTPASFFSLLELSIKLGLFEYELAHFVPTPRDSLEFYVTLRFAPQRSRFDRLRSLRNATAQLARAEEPGGWSPATADNKASDPPSGHAWMLVSNKERSAILGKRNLLRRLR